MSFSFYRPLFFPFLSPLLSPFYSTSLPFHSPLPTSSYLFSKNLVPHSPLSSNSGPDSYSFSYLQNTLKIYSYLLPSSLNYLKSRLYHHILKFQFLFVEIRDTIAVSPISDKIDNSNVRVLLRKFNSYWKPTVMYDIQNVIYSL